MEPEGGDCGPLYSFYAAARAGDIEAVRTQWSVVRDAADTSDDRRLDRIEEAVESGDLETARIRAADLVFEATDDPSLTGPIPRLVGALLYGFGYLAAFVLFFRAHGSQTVVRRLRWAYRTVGVDVRDTEAVDGAERTVFRCPYRNLGADRWGKRRVCHDLLDRVDDGYVAWLARHRDLDYRRPRACAASECCYSEVVEP